jgi:anti-anti-sigma factor
MTQEPTETPDISNYLSSEEQNRKLIFTLHRELVNAEWNNISHVGNQMLEEVEERNKPQVMIDLSQLEHMGSSMVALLVRIWKRAEAKGGAVSFLSTNEGINQVLELAGLAKVWTICDNQEEALDQLGGTTEQTGRNLAPFLVFTSLICAAIAGAMLAMKLTGQHLIDVQIEPQLQIAAGAVGGILGIWAFCTSHRVSKFLGLISAVACIGLAAYSIYSMVA